MNWIRNKNVRKRTGWIILGLLAAVALTGCLGEDEETLETIVLADAGWDSIRFHNGVIAAILEDGYGYETSVTMGSTPATLQGLISGDIHIYSELWIESVWEAYSEALDAGEVIQASVNFDDNAQGLYVPTYVIEGDPERGIEPMAPGLRSIADLPDYWEVFQDPEDRNKGRIYGSIPGWEADNTLQFIFEGLGLDETYNYFRPGSEAALNTSLVTAINNGEAWVGYNWEPTWITGLYDLTRLEIPLVDGEAVTQFEPNDVVVAVYAQLPELAPEVMEFLENYTTSSQITSDALALIEEVDASLDDAVDWFLEAHEDLWTAWVPTDVSEKVKAARQ